MFNIHNILLILLVTENIKIGNNNAPPETPIQLSLSTSFVNINPIKMCIRDRYCSILVSQNASSLFDNMSK